MFEETNRRLRGHRFYPTREELVTYPKTYDQDGKGLDATVHAHYFSANADWWITEFDPDFAASGEAFGYVRFHHYPEGAELGYIYLPELEELKVIPRAGLPVPIIVERDLHWTPKTIREAARICSDTQHYCDIRSRCAA